MWLLLITSTAITWSQTQSSLAWVILRLLQLSLPHVPLQSVHSTADSMILLNNLSFTLEPPNGTPFYRGKSKFPTTNVKFIQAPLFLISFLTGLLAYTTSSKLASLLFLKQGKWSYSCLKALVFLSIQNTLSKHIHIASSLLKYFCKSYLLILLSDLPCQPASWQKCVGSLNL